MTEHLYPIPSIGSGDDTKPWGRLKRASTCVALAFTAISAATVATAPSAAADTTVTVNWTQIGIWPRSAPSMDATKVGTPLSDGSGVTIVCEVEAQPVSNGYQTIAIWDQLSDGSWLPNAFLDTGSASWTPGVPRCAVPEAPIPAPAGSSADSRIWIPTDVPAAASLYTHYILGSGEPVWLDPSVAVNAGIEDVVRSIPVGEHTLWRPSYSSDLFWASGSFTVYRTSERCWSTYDDYDFDPDKWQNYPYISLYLTEAVGGWKPFPVYSEGCLSGGASGGW